MSDRREELVEIRKKIIMGDPPYRIDNVMKAMTRGFGGQPGLDELRKLGDFAAGAASLRLLFEIQLQLIDHLIERTR